MNGPLSLGSVQSSAAGKDVYVVDDTSGLGNLKSHDAIALVDDLGNVVQFISFEGGTVTATEGPADGLTSTDIGTAGASESLQSDDGGSSYYTQTAPNEGTIPCYVAGTLIKTPDGMIPVEELAEGDQVSTIDGPAARIVHVASRYIRASELRAFPNLRPVIIPGDPTLGGDLIVSPLHRVLVREPELEKLFGLSAAFVAARDAPGARPAPIGDLTYVHFLCEDHVAVTASGCESESLFPGGMALYFMGPRERDAVLSKLSDRPQRTAFPCLTSREAAVFRDAIQSREMRLA